MENRRIPGQDTPKNLKIEWQKEVNTWMKTLMTRMNESATIKNTIADILKNGFEQNCLDEIEKFQTESICEDEIIELLRIEVAELEDLLLRPDMEKTISEESLRKIINKLRKDMAYSEDRFNSLCAAFREFKLKLCL